MVADSVIEFPLINLFQLLLTLLPISLLRKLSMSKSGLLDLLPLLCSGLHLEPGAFGRSGGLGPTRDTPKEGPEKDYPQRI